MHVEACNATEHPLPAWFTEWVESVGREWDGFTFPWLEATTQQGGSHIKTYAYAWDRNELPSPRAVAEILRRVTWQVSEGSAEPKPEGEHVTFRTREWLPALPETDGLAERLPQVLIVRIPWQFCYQRGRTVSVYCRARLGVATCASACSLLTGSSWRTGYCPLVGGDSTG
jgi:hypothetical protein